MIDTHPERVAKIECKKDHYCQDVEIEANKLDI